LRKNISVLIASRNAQFVEEVPLQQLLPQSLNSKNYQNSILQLIVVFVLNAVALFFVFPFIGHKLGLSQENI
jgi:hypothetical protein